MDINRVFAIPKLKRNSNKFDPNKFANNKSFNSFRFYSKIEEVKEVPDNESGRD